MKKIVLAALFLTSSSLVHAATVVEGSGTLEGSDPDQSGRAIRNSVQSTWDFQKSYPGTLSAGSLFNYDVIDATFSANTLQPIFYEINFINGNSTSNIYAAAYLNSFDSSNISLNFLGDAGQSTGFPGLTNRIFQVQVPLGGRLILNFMDINNLDGALYSYRVSAFSDAQRSEAFLTAAVPEPATWFMMIMGLGFVGSAMRAAKRRQKFTLSYS